MKLILRKLLLPISTLCLSYAAVAQFDTDGYVNPNSMFNIPVYEQVYKVRVWREMFLREKQNKGFFARGNEVTGIIIQAVKSGEIARVYKNDSLSEKSVYTKDEFLQNMQMRAKVVYDPWDQNKNYIATDNVIYNGVDYQALQDNSGQLPNAPPPNDYWQVFGGGQALTFMPVDMDKLEILEDIIFDKRRSRLYYDIQAIRIWAYDEQGIAYKQLGWIKYKDIERVFRAHPDKSVWFNRQNTAQNRNFADAFLLRLFHATIKKMENPDDLELAGFYPNNYKDAVMAREWEEMKLMEKEHNLWEY